MLKACIYPARHLMFMSNDNSSLLTYDNLHVNRIHFKSRGSVDNEFSDIEKQIQINVRLSFKKQEPVEQPSPVVKIDTAILKRKLLPDNIGHDEVGIKIDAILNRIISDELFLINFTRNKKFKYEIDAVLEVKHMCEMAKSKNKNEDDDNIYKKLKNNKGLAYGRKCLTEA